MTPGTFILSDILNIRPKTNSQHLSGSLRSRGSGSRCSGQLHGWCFPKRVQGVPLAQCVRCLLTTHVLVLSVCCALAVRIPLGTEALSSRGLDLLRGTSTSFAWVWHGEGAPVWHPCPFLYPRMEVGRGQPTARWHLLQMCFLITGMTCVARCSFLW